MPPHLWQDRRTLALPALVIVLALLAAPARAANDLFLRISTLTGESIAAGHTGDIDALSFSWGANRSGTTSSAGNFVVTKRIDKTSIALMQATFTALHFATVTFFARSQGANALDFFKVTLTDVTFTSYQTTGSASDSTLVEVIAMNFASIKFDYQPQNPDGTTNGGIVTGGYNVQTAQKI